MWRGLARRQSAQFPRPEQRWMTEEKPLALFELWRNLRARERLPAGAMNAHFSLIEKNAQVVRNVRYGLRFAMSYDGQASQVKRVTGRRRELISLIVLHQSSIRTIAKRVTRCSEKNRTPDSITGNWMTATKVGAANIKRS